VQVSSVLPLFAWEERARESSTYNLEQIRQHLAKNL
jgi:hypothetical protein